jgi:RND family efflux transporter MFP subunit
MDPVDLDERIQAQEAALKRAGAQLNEARARRDYARIQALRYEETFKARATSEEMAVTKRQELRVAEAGLLAAEKELVRVRAERRALEAQRRNLLLRAPVDGLVVSREADPGTTLVAGQAVVEVIDPHTLWINVRFDQISAQGLAADLPARITLRSQAGKQLAGQVLRVEPLADAITEETLAKIVFERLPTPLPPVGELAEVTVELPEGPSAPVLPNAVIQRIDGRLGVWQVEGDRLRFTPVVLGIGDLEGRVQIREGLSVGDQVVIYSENALNEHSRIDIVDQIPGVAP